MSSPGRPTCGRHPLRQIFVAAAILAVAGCNGGDKNLVSVVVALPDHAVPNAARATLVVDYSGSNSRIHYADGAPDCAIILPGVDGDFADDGQGTLTIHTSGERALRGPADVAACRMEATEGATGASLREQMTVRVTEALDAGGKAIDVASVTARPRAARSEEAIQQAQADAVKTAASISAAAPPPAALSPADGMVPAGVPPPAGMGTIAPKPGLPGGAPPPVPGAAGAGAPKPPAPRPGTATGPRNLATGPGASSAVGAANSGAGGADSGVIDDSAVNAGDRDPSYDDSDSDNPNVPAYTLTFEVQGQGGRFGALQFEVNHLGRSGGFIGREDTIDCVPLVDAIVAGNFVGERLAKFGLISLQGVPFNMLILNCGFRTREPLSSNSFAIEVTDASDTNSNPIDPPPTVVLRTVARR
jgi:hypothetical protein